MISFKQLSAGIVTAATLGAVISLGALFSAHHSVFDIISHFRVQYIALLLIPYVLAMWTRKSKSFLIISIALAIHGYVVTMALLALPGFSSEEDYTELTVLNSNVLWSNKNHQELIALVNEVDPDVIALQEYTLLWDEVLSEALVTHPHKVALPRASPFGIALFSKYPFTEGSTRIMNQDGLPFATAQIIVEDRPVQVFSVHPPPPISNTVFKRRNAIMELIGQEVSKALDHTIVMGDLNATPWTSAYSNLTSKGQLHNARAGNGFHPTWPHNNFFLQIPIDHILISDRIRSAYFDSAKLEGSDHRAIWATLRIY